MLYTNAPRRYMVSTADAPHVEIQAAYEKLNAN